MATATEPAKPTNDKNEKAWTNWPSVFKAARTLGLKVPQVRMLVQTGDLPCFEASDGTQRFDPEVLNRIRTEVQGLTDEDFDESLAAKRREEQERDAQAERTGIPVEGIREQGNFLRTVMNHNQQLHQIIRDMAADARQNLNATSGVQEAVIKRLQDQVFAYQKMIDSVIAEREAQANQRAERELLLMQEKDKIDRRQQVLGIARDQVGKLVAIVAAKFGLDEHMLQALASKFDVKKAMALFEFFESLNVDQIDIAMASGFFTPEQVAKLSEITGRPAPGEQQQPEPEAPPEAATPAQPQPTESEST